MAAYSTVIETTRDMHHKAVLKTLPEASTNKDYLKNTPIDTSRTIINDTARGSPVPSELLIDTV